jgi:hypothetical protein
MADEVFDGPDMVRQLFGESQGVPDEAGDALPQRVNELPRSKLRGINPPLARSYGPPVGRGRAGVPCVCFPANLKTTPDGRLGDAVAYSLCHCPVVLHMLQKPKQASRNLTQEIEF